MQEQLTLDGVGHAPLPTDRLFFALYPDAEAAEHIAQMARHLRTTQGLHGAPLKTERFHVTLHHLGDHVGLPQDVFKAASAAAASMAVPPFEIVFDRAASFPGRAQKRPFVLLGGEGVAPAIAFQQALGTALKQAGLGRWISPKFVPHTTLLYDERRVPEQPIDPIAWKVREFVLVDSLLGQTRHVPLARWPLSA